MKAVHNRKFNPSYTDAPNIRFSLRLTEKLQNDLEIYSNKCHISMNTLILKCIEYALDNKEEI